MNAERLLDLYDHVAEAADAITRLRRFVLDLAASGRLVHSDQAWECVSIEECLEPLSDGSSIHQGWSPRCETFPASSLDKWGVLKTTAIQDGFFLEHENKELPERFSPKQKLEIAAGDILITSAGPRARCGIACYVPNVRRRLMISGKMYRFRADQSRILTDFLALVLRSSEAWAAIDAMKTGSSESGLNLTKGRFRNLRIRFGSLEEQHRIVAKVDELLALCDELEAARAKRETKRDRLTAASLKRISSPHPDPEVFTSDARFVLDNLAAVTARADQVDALRQAILSLAVRGKLVEHEPSAEPASELLKRISAEKREILVAKKLRAKKAIAKPSEEPPFEVPKNWVWCQLDELAWKITDGDHATPKRETSGHYLLSARNVLNGRIDLSKVDYVGDAEFERMRNRCDPDKSDLLISCSGSIGRVAVVDKDEAYVLVRSAALVKPVFADRVAPYLAKALLSDCLQYQMEFRSKAAAQPNLFLGSIRQLLVPLPPLAEQEHIVAKVDLLFSLCDQLEAELAKRDCKRSHLLHTLLHEALRESTLGKRLPTAAE